MNKEMSKLLIHGDFDSADDISALSVLNVNLAQTLRDRPEFIGLYFSAAVISAIMNIRDQWQ